MPLAEAKALLRHAHFEPQDRSADIEALQELALRCQRFSPRIGIRDEEALLMEVTGCAHLFGGERGMVRQVAGFLRRAGFVGRISLAGTIGAAWGGCRYGRAGVVPHEESEATLCQLPVAALRLAPSLIETLHELEIRTIGQLRALPRGSLPSRFGVSAATRLDQTFGELPELIVPVRAPECIRAAWTFDEPVTDRRTLELSLDRLIGEVAGSLRDRQKGAQQLTCHLDGLSFTIGTTGPTASPSHLWELVRLRLERLTLPREVTRIEIRVSLTATRVEQQLPLMPDERLEEGDLRLLLDRLGSRLGEEALLRPKLVPDPLPEFACRFDPILKSETHEASDTTANPAGMVRPVRLIFPPLPVEAISLVPEGPPVRFQWKNALQTIGRHWGPERIESGWWRSAQVRRDYYRVETTTGERFWLFRANGKWFLHGVFD